MQYSASLLHPPANAPLAQRLEQIAPRITRLDLGFGLAGVALFFLGRYQQHGKGADLESARQLVWSCLDRLTAAAHSPSLIELIELSRLLETFAPTLDLENAHRQVAELFDGMIERWMQACFKAGNLDPYTGGFNAALYLLERKRAFRLSGTWLGYLPSAADLRQKSEAGAFTIPSGIAHGLAFYAYFLARYLDFQPTVSEVRARAADYLEALAERRQHPDRHGCFYQDGGARGGRVSLVYGDCGILFSTWRLARAMGDEARAEAALDDLETTARRRLPAATGITDNGLIYGRTGAWLFFHRLAELTGRPTFSEAATHWKNSVDRNAPGNAPSLQFTDYDYPAMKRISLYEGVLGPPVISSFLATNPTFLYEYLYLL